MATTVVGYDGSACARAALAHAANTVAAGDEIVVVHAYGPPSEWLGRPWYQKVLDEHRSDAAAVLDGAADEARRLGVEIETDLIGGPAAEAIVNAAHARKAERIVIGSRGYGPLRAALGSVSLRVLHQADRPVVVVPVEQ
jgi:nucleotide-binding universal stress UspA family protein